MWRIEFGFQKKIGLHKRVPLKLIGVVLIDSQCWLLYELTNFLENKKNFGIYNSTRGAYYIWLHLSILFKEGGLATVSLCLRARIYQFNKVKFWHPILAVLTYLIGPLGVKPEENAAVKVVIMGRYGVTLGNWPYKILNKLIYFSYIIKITIIIRQQVFQESRVKMQSIFSWEIKKKKV